MHSTRHGRGKPLLLVHGLGNTQRSWQPILAALAGTREVVTLDLPGHGASPAEDDSATFDGLARSLAAFLTREDLDDVDMWWVPRSAVASSSKWRAAVGRRTSWHSILAVSGVDRRAKGTPLVG